MQQRRGLGEKCRKRLVNNRGLQGKGHLSFLYLGLFLAVPEIITWLPDQMMNR
jgi:hypothetical protein